MKKATNKPKTKAAKAAARKQYKLAISPDKNVPDWRHDNCISEFIRIEINTDCDFAGDEDLARFYRHLEAGQRAAVDVTMIKVCGWSLETIIAAVEQRLPLEEVETGKDNPYITLMKSAEKE
jgi:hypothetical protein